MSPTIISSSHYGPSPSSSAEDQQLGPTKANEARFLTQSFPCARVTLLMMPMKLDSAEGRDGLVILWLCEFARKLFFILLRNPLRVTRSRCVIVFRCSSLRLFSLSLQLSRCMFCVWLDVVSLFFTSPFLLVAIISFRRLNGSLHRKKERFFLFAEKKNKQTKAVSHREQQQRNEKKFFFPFPNNHKVFRAGVITSLNPPHFSRERTFFAHEKPTQLLGESERKLLNCRADTHFPHFFRRATADDDFSLAAASAST